MKLIIKMWKHQNTNQKQIILNIYLSTYIYIYKSIYTYICIHTYIYIYAWKYKKQCIKTYWKHEKT